MTPRILLVCPPSPDRLGAPLLGLQHVAAALVACGAEVRVIDAAARFFDHDLDWIAAEAEGFAPQVVGIPLFTRNALNGYRLAATLRDGPWALVAGGPHATTRPVEALQHGFDAAVIGEAESAASALVEVASGRLAIDQLPSSAVRAADGTTRITGPRTWVEDLDSLPSPRLAHLLFDPPLYRRGATSAAPGGALASRGCPSRCTFCANDVTGRRVRWRSPASVVAELEAYHAADGTAFFPFWDDALTCDPARVLALCAALERDASFPVSWSAITRANMLTPAVLHAMKRAGCLAVNIGAESGDLETLLAIGKGLTPGHVVRALEWARAEGLRTICNFMMGFPGESVAALECTLRFMERIAPMVDAFSTMGVVVPYPGTAIYDAWHERCGFTDWWLRPAVTALDTTIPDDPVENPQRFRQRYRSDPFLDFDFFNYDQATREAIVACLTFKADHNLARMGSVGGEPIGMA